MDSNGLWGVYGRQGMQLYGGRDNFIGWSGERMFALLTGEPVLDLKLSAAITASEADAIRLDEIAVRYAMEVAGPVPKGYL